MNIADDADDLRPGLVVLPAAELDPPADRIFIGENLSRRFLADDGDLRRRLGVCLREIAAAAQRDSRRREITGADNITIDAGNLRTRNMTILNVKARLIESAEISCKRRRACQRNRLDTGKAAHTFENFSLRGESDLVALIFLARQRKIRLVQIVSGDAGINAPRANEAFQKQARRDGENKCEADLRRYEHGAKFALPAGDAASRALQRHAMIDARCLQRRREAHYNAGRSADEQCEEQHAGIDMNVGDARNLRRRPLRDQMRAPDCEQNSRDSTERTEQHALG